LKLIHNGATESEEQVDRVLKVIPFGRTLITIRASAIARVT
jgi:hypothetical protein